MRLQEFFRTGALGVAIVAMLASASNGWAQAAGGGAGSAASQPNITVEQPDAQRTKDELSQLLDHYPPSLP